jgi:APA family basic amino acid/polyamine antiporter
MSQSESGKISLVRGLGLLAAVSILVGNVIGTGVFLKARVMTCNVGKPSTVIFVWIFAGLLSLAGALTYAELAAMMPRAGGEYNFLKEGYGRAWSFLYGWMQIFIAKTGSQAAVAVAFAIFLNDAVGGSLMKVLFTAQLLGTQFSITTLQLIAVAMIILFAILNCATVALSGHVATVLTFVKIGLIVLVGFGAFIWAQGHFSNFSLINEGGACYDVDAAAHYGAVGYTFLAGFGAAMLAALWGYDGWNNLTLVAGEIKNPQRNIPLALIGGTAVIILLYVFINVAYFYVLTPTQIANVTPESSVAREVVQTTFGDVGIQITLFRVIKIAPISIMAMGLMASSLGTLHTSILTGARVPYAMAQDGNFFKSFGKLSATTHVPVIAILAQSVWACLLALSGSFDTLTDYVIFGSWIFYGLATASVFVFRMKMPNAERPYKAWGYPVVPVLFLFVTAFLLINTIMTSTTKALIGLVLIVLGLPVYFYLASKKLNEEDD